MVTDCKAFLKEFRDDEIPAFHLAPHFPMESTRLVATGLPVAADQ